MYYSKQHRWTWFSSLRNRRFTIASGSMLISGNKLKKKKKVNKTKNQDNMLCHNKSLYKT